MFIMSRRPVLIVLASMVYGGNALLLKAENLDGESAANAVLFDGAAKYQVKAPASVPAEKNKALLAEELGKRVTLDDHGSPAEKAALESMILRMMDSPTARETAEEFIKEGAGAAISFEELPGVPATVNGQKIIMGARGQTWYQENPPRVVLNKNFMLYETEAGIGTLAHEMFGHVLEKKLAGTPDYIYNGDEEENARLIGWLVDTELGVRPMDAIWEYVQNPEEFTESLNIMSADYAITLTSREMKDPAPVYTRRLAAVEKTWKKAGEKEKMYGLYPRWIAHFVTSHAMDPGSFSTVMDEVDGKADSLPGIRANLTEVKAVLSGKLAYFASGEGKAFLNKLAREADSDYFKQKDALVRERRKRLERLLSGKTQAGSRPPPAAGQISYDEFKELVKKDLNCPFAATLKADMELSGVK
jgi:hypothetical protein